MQQLSSLDALFLALENDTTYGHVCGLAVVDPSTTKDGTFGRRDLLRVIRDRIGLLPPFTRRLAEVPFGLDHPYWIEDPDFDLDYHVRDIALASPGTDKQLADQVARIASRALDRRRPLWELYVIQGLKGDRAAVLTKIHHAVVDGVSGQEILSVLFDLEPEGTDRGEVEDRTPDRVPGWPEMLSRGLLGLPRQPARAVGALPGMLPNLDEIPGVNAVPGVGLVGSLSRRAQRMATRNRDGRVIEWSSSRAPKTVFSGRISPHRRFAFTSLSLADVKAIKNHFGLTVNDVVMALCASGIRGYLQRHDDLPGDPLVAMVPVSVRTKEEMGTYGNRVSAMMVPIPTDVADPAERLEQAHRCMLSAKERHKATPASLMQDAAKWIPPAISARAARVSMELGSSRPPFNVVISNVPGPPMPLYCAGAELQSHIPVSVVTDGVGLNLTVMSYRDHIDFGLTADREMAPDLWTMVDDIRAGFEELKALLPPEETEAAERETAEQTA
jgi:WS/DGAT/MGAT family acyltransferase